MMINGGFGGVSFMYGLFTIVPLIMFALIIAGIVIVILKSLGLDRGGHGAPVLTVPATLISKREEMHDGWTRYHLTFQVESGDRMEFPVEGPEYGVLVEGDRGSLTFQGMRYMGFHRK